MANKVYASICQTYYECGDESGNDYYIVGIFDNPADADNEGNRYLYETFKYDDESGIYYGDFANEAWIDVYEYELGSTEGGGLMAKDKDKKMVQRYKEI